MTLSPQLEADLRTANPWWRGERLFGLPPLRRWTFHPIREGLQSGLTQATVLRGPRQVGKTTVLNQVIDSLLNEDGDPKRILRLQFDDLPEVKKLSEPILALYR